MDTYQDQRDQYYRIMGKNSASQHVADGILRLAEKVQRLFVLECNRKLSPNEKTTKDRAQARIINLASDAGIVAHVCEGDPRGAAVKLILSDGAYNTMGGAEDGWAVPTR